MSAKVQTVIARVDESLRREVEDAAALEGKDLSTYLREALRMRVKATKRLRDEDRLPCSTVSVTGPG